MAGTERIVRIVHAGGVRPPYHWQIVGIGEKGTKILLEQGQGSWITALFRAQDISKELGIKPKNSTK